MSAARSSAAQQPDLRAFIVYDRAPAGSIPFLVTNDRTAPHLRLGDIALVDTTDREPAERELFLIRWMSGDMDIVETWSRAGRYGCGPNGEIKDSVAWWVADYNRPRTSAELEDRIRSGGILTGFADGPYASEGPNAGYLQSKLVGRVIGLLEPSANEPRRITA